MPGRRDLPGSAPNVPAAPERLGTGTASAGSWTGGHGGADNRGMTRAELPTSILRPSESERERALEVLREGASDGRLSHDTFLGRLDLVLRATSRAELDAALAGLPVGGRLESAVLRAVGRISGFRARFTRAWRSEQLPGLKLPQARLRLLTIGRVPGSGLLLNDASVSRQHAELRREGSGWVLYDLGSTNGTHVNGHRIAGAVRVRAGDLVRFGHLEYRLEPSAETGADGPSGQGW
ncbi:uncharacterized protein DUF1707 [Kitasatospora viridis]|uniref:Uncharacterized protein DUF1707 n=2 Tax=Kitasatospora viridis TaxID=281105 RepID=A0A561SE65_9ACTN|nr:uncharacterized protein DUF1707 [Kitasatospora viridis]